MLINMNKIDHILKIPEQYRKYITFKSDNCCILSKVLYFNPGCNHISDTRLDSVIKRKQFEYCYHCHEYFKYKDYYLSKIPKKYHNNIIWLSDKRGQNSKVKYINYVCKHESITNLQALSLRKQFDLCKKCNLRLKVKTDANLFLDRIPQKYHQYITFNDGYSRDCKVSYLNIGCNHISKCSIGVLSKRKNFELCIDCSSKNRLDTINVITDRSIFLSNIPEKYHKNITFLSGCGYNEVISYYHSSCGHVSNSTLYAFSIRKQFELCHSCNQKTIRAKLLSKEKMISNLPYLKDAKIISGYPGNRSTIISGRCKKCNSFVKNTYFRLLQYYNFYQKAQCKKCMPKNFSQTEVLEFIRSLNIKVEENNRKIVKGNGKHFKEIDIYCPEEKFAIEYNGLIWHSEKYSKDSDYHYNKSTECAKLGIDLLHIWGDKYINNKEIYYSIIKEKLNLTENILLAKDLKIKELELNQIENFFGKNHIDGNGKCLLGYGLFNKEKLIQAISIIPNEENYIKIVRLCTLINYKVEKGKNKLLNFVVKYSKGNGYKGVIYYENIDFSNSLKKIRNFEYIGNTECDYCYTDGGKRILRNDLEISENVLEDDIVEELGLIKVNLTPNRIYKLNC